MRPSDGRGAFQLALLLHPTDSIAPPHPSLLARSPVAVYSASCVIPGHSVCADINYTLNRASAPHHVVINWP
ncbi:hypothetical protein BDN70DRAFT_668330 [Pholiota conissans]|uniref:Uncharacterized protein n=1 Tax=Pholiota conissans TaxID=109636 RepID=A0A9P6CQX5_9AGAR|nr:hypothetical protein BDN70DRAFT_668330 [Pholiota conissans]